MKVLIVTGIVCLSIFFIGCKNKKEIENFNSITSSPLFKFVEINSKNFYILHNGGLMGTETLIEIAPSKSKFNTTLLEYKAYSRNNNPLEIVKTYKLHLKNVSKPDFSKLSLMDEELVLSYEKSDSIWHYFDYSIYVPSENKTYWINPYNGIDKNEGETLKWIKENISKISVKEAVNYAMFNETKKTIDNVNKNLYYDNYIISNNELCGLPHFVK